MTHASTIPTVALPCDRPRLLWREDQGWQVATGFVDLFAVRTEGGEATGRREFLTRLKPDQICLPLPMAGHLGLIAVGGQDATIRPLEAVPHHLPTPLLDGWIASLCDSMGEAAQGQRTSLHAAAEGTLSMAAGETLGGPGRQTLWGELTEGDAQLAGDDDRLQPSQPPLPVAGTMQIYAHTDCRWDFVTTADLQKGHGLADALAAFHAVAVRAIGQSMAWRQRQLADLAANRAVLSQRALEAAYGELAQVITPGLTAVRPAVDDDPAMAALRRVAQAIGETVVEPPRDLIPAAPSNRQHAILRASRLRWRTVLLRDGWWTSSSGPLAARWQDSGQPVALLPAGRTGYVAWDPASGQEQFVTPAIAAALAPQAVMVYPRLAGRKLSAGDLLRLGLRDAGSDGLRILLLALGAALLALLVPMASGLLVEQIIPNAERGQLATLVAGLVAAALCAASFDLTKSLVLLRMEGGLDALLQAALFDRLLRLPAAFFKRYAVGDLADRVLGVQAIRQMLAGATVASLLGGVFSVVSLGMLFFYSVPLAFMAVGLAFLLCLVVGGLTWAQLRHERKLALMRGRVEGFLLQLIIGVGKITVAAARERALSHWARIEAQQKRHTLAAQSVARLQAIFMVAFPPLTSIAVFLAVAWVAKDSAATAQIKALANVDTGKDAAVEAMGAGAFLAFNAALGQFLSSMAQAVRSMTGVLGAVPLWERARPVLDQPPEDGDDRHSPGPLNGGVEFSAVSFAYHQDGPLVLKDFSAEIRLGDYVALVGPSGSGKSTVMRLLMGLEQPSSGEVFFDGKPLSRLDLGLLRSQIGVVLQNSRVLPGSIFVNIMGTEEGRLEDAWEATRMVGLDADIRAMPMGMHTVLLEGGATLSGGQRQRLAIARALVHKPRILLLDEATSALDNRTQAIVSQSLGRLNITRIVIAHRLNTISHVDHVLVMDQGRLVQQGRFEDLIATPGLFADMASRQVL